MEKTENNAKEKIHPALLVAMLTLGLISGALITSKISSYVGSTSKEIGFWLILAMPFLIGLCGGMYYTKKPYLKSLLLLVIYMASSAPMYQEGLICILMYLPFASIFTILACGLVTVLKTNRKNAKGLVLLFALPALFAEADSYLLPVERPVIEIADSVVINLSPDEIWNRIAHTRFQFDRTQLPLPVQHLMPAPLSVTGLGAGVGDQRVIDFHNGTIVATIQKSRAPEFFEFGFELKSRGPEFFDHWVNFETSSFEFRRLSATQTLVTHTTKYKPRVYPRWYFEPVEKYLAHQTQSFMIRNFFAPNEIETEMRVSAR